MKKLSVINLICLVLIIFGLGAEAGIYIQRHNSRTLNVSNDSVEEFLLVEQAWNILHGYYVDQSAVQPQTLAYATITGMVNSLGDNGHSTFLTPQQVQEQNDFQQGKLYGIGAEIEERNGHVVIIAVLDSSPAQEAGLRSGDIILEVDGQPLTDFADALKRIRGQEGTSVTVTIQNPSGETRDMTMVRKTINLVRVTWQQLPDTTIAHLRISSFSTGTTEELDKALADIKAQGNSGIILDLRDNPGGFLDEAVNVASRFLDSGNVLLEKDSKGKITPFAVAQGVDVTELPLVALVNNRTASAAEIVAGALKDAGRAEILGETTFGTGTILNQFILADGSALIVGVLEWLTPSGNTIWHVGLTPDKIVPLAAGVSPLFPGSETGLTFSQLQASGDDQLLDALNILTPAN